MTVKACNGGDFCQLIPIPFMIPASIPGFIEFYYPGFHFVEIVNTGAR